MVYGLSLGQPMGLKSDEGQALLWPKAEAPSQEKPTPDVSIGSQGTDGMFCSTAGVGVRVWTAVSRANKMAERGVSTFQSNPV